MKEFEFGIKDGENQDTMVGFLPKDAIKNNIEKYL